ncbi:MAG: cysteine desulfurase family protein [Spirochaetaceae bacterium]|jgi:cysteine desulfurase|nr:cysteine desulfurase family protein [Spirochaetaceae bacterium]
MKNCYFDYNSTTPVNLEVQGIILDLIQNNYGNPSNIHSEGRDARERLEISRQEVAELIGADKNEIYFTSSGSEANNLALKGLRPLYESGKNHIITSITEHSSIYETAKHLNKRGIELTLLSVDSDGKIDLNQLKQSIKKNTALISIMTANNETGVLQNMDAIANIAGEKGIILHSDAVQAMGKIPVNVNNPQFDMLTLSSHKIYGPKGVGALYIRKGLSIESQIHGGGQEKKIRSGTENIPLIGGFGEACRIIGVNFDKDVKHMSQMKNMLYRGIAENIKCLKLNGSLDVTLPNTLNISFPGFESETLILDLDSAGFSVSAGAACSEMKSGSSRILKAMKLKPAELFSSLRFSIGRETKEKDVLRLVETLTKIVRNLN